MAFISTRLFETPRACFRLFSASNCLEGLANNCIYPKLIFSRGYSTHFHVGSVTTSKIRLLPYNKLNRSNIVHSGQSVLVSQLLLSRPRMITSTSSTANAVNAPKASGVNEGESPTPLQEKDGVDSPPPAPSSPEVALSTKEKLKRAVKDYGATVIIFHITMSLMSLGFFYLLVSSGLDVIALLGKIGISESFLQSKVTEEASKFVVAYAVHKVFAPLRITVTLTATPLIVRKLRSMGILKQAVKAKSS